MPHSPGADAVFESGLPPPRTSAAACPPRPRRAAAGLGCPECWGAYTRSTPAPPATTSATLDTPTHRPRCSPPSARKVEAALWTAASILEEQAVIRPQHRATGAAGRDTDAVRQAPRRGDAPRRDPWPATATAIPPGPRRTHHDPRRARPRWAPGRAHHMTLARVSIRDSVRVGLFVVAPMLAQGVIRRRPCRRSCSGVGRRLGPNTSPCAPAPVQRHPAPRPAGRPRYDGRVDGLHAADVFRPFPARPRCSTGRRGWCRRRGRTADVVLMADAVPRRPRRSTSNGQTTAIGTCR